MDKPTSLPLHFIFILLFCNNYCVPTSLSLLNVNPSYITSRANMGANKYGAVRIEIEENKLYL
jgi:hypothetical protein